MSICEVGCYGSGIASWWGRGLVVVVLFSLLLRMDGWLHRWMDG